MPRKDRPAPINRHREITESEIITKEERAEAIKLGAQLVRHGACRGLSLSEFFPGKGFSPTAAAKAACARCLVRSECITYAYRLHLFTSTGYYGSMTPVERRGRTLDEALAEYGNK